MKLKENADIPQPDRTDDFENRQKLTAIESIDKTRQKLGSKIKVEGVQINDDSKLMDLPLAKLQKIATTLEEFEKNRDNLVKSTDLLEKQTLSTAARKTLEKLKDAALTPEGKFKKKTDCDALEKFVKTQIERMPKHATAQNDFEKIAKLPDAAETFSDVKITLPSKTGGEKKIEGLITADEFTKLSLSQKTKLLAEMKRVLKEKTAENKTLAGARDRLLADKNLPKDWGDWLKNPESWSGGKPEQRTLGYAVEWVENHLGELKLSATKFEKLLTTENHNLEKFQIKTPTLDEFRDLSPDDRSKKMKTIENSLKHAKKEFEQKGEAVATADSAAASAISSAESEKATEAAETQNEKIQKFFEKICVSKPLLRNRLMAEIEKKKDAAKNDAAAGKADQIANLRQQTASGQRTSLLDRARKFFGGEEETNEATAGEEDLEAHTRIQKATIREIVGAEEGKEKMLDDKDYLAFEDIFGAREPGITPEDEARILELVTVKQPDIRDFEQRFAQKEVRESLLKTDFGKDFYGQKPNSKDDFDYAAAA